jgi:hypothetical protein
MNIIMVSADSKIVIFLNILLLYLGLDTTPTISAASCVALTSTLSRAGIPYMLLSPTLVGVQTIVSLVTPALPRADDVAHITTRFSHNRGHRHYQCREQCH